MRVRALVILGLLLGAHPGCPEGSTPSPPVSDGSALQIKVDEFAFGVIRAGGGAGQTITTADCAPLSVDLRLPDTNGFIDVTDPLPRSDTETLRSAGGRVVDGADGAFVVDVDLVDGAGARRSGARVTARASDEGFVDIDVDFVSDGVDERDVAFVAACFARAADEHIVGGGERFDGPDLSGKITPLVFSAPGDTASGTNEAHVPVPFFATTRGLGVLVESERTGAIDATLPGAVQVRFSGARLPLRLRAARPRTSGPARELVVDNVAAFARRMGLPKPVPTWALMPMQWRNDLEVTFDEGGAIISSGTDMLLGDVAAMRARDLPFSTVWIDAPWQTGYNTFVVNEVQLPDIAAAFDVLADNGLHALVWATEHINVSDDSDQAPGMPPFASRPLYERFRDEGYLVTTESGDPFTFPWGRGQGAFVDFTNPAACAAFQEQMLPLIRAGVRGFKLDYGESMRPDILGVVDNTIPVFFDGTTTAVQHTRYARLYHECYADALQKVYGDDWFIITRTGGLFDQRTGVAIWPGDLDSDFSRLGDSDAADPRQRAVGGIGSAIGGALSLAMSGYPLYGADIGGYRGDRATSEAFVRSAEASIGQTVFQVGGGANQAPWDPEYADVAAAFDAVAKLRASLWPMFQTWLARATRGGDGTPVVVPLGVAMGSDAYAWDDPDAMVLGDALAFYPVVRAGAVTRDVRLPPGAWFHLLTGTRIRGPLTTPVRAPLGQPALFLREGAVLVLDRASRTLLPSTTRPALASDRVVVAAPGPASAVDHVVAGGLVVHQTTTLRDGVIGSVAIDIDVEGDAAEVTIELLGGPWEDPRSEHFVAESRDGRLVLSPLEPIDGVAIVVTPAR